MELVHRDAVGALSKHFNLIVAFLLITIIIGPLIGANLGRRDQAEDLVRHRNKTTEFKMKSESEDLFPQTIELKESVDKWKNFGLI